MDQYRHPISVRDQNIRFSLGREGNHIAALQYKE